MTPVTITANAVEQKGLAPKLLVDTITTVIVFALLTLLPDLDVNQDPVLIGVIAKAAGFLAGFIVKPGRVTVIN